MWDNLTLNLFSIIAVSIFGYHVKNRYIREPMPFLVVVFSLQGCFTGKANLTRGWHLVVVTWTNVWLLLRDCHLVLITWTIDPTRKCTFPLFLHYFSTSIASRQPWQQHTFNIIKGVWLCWKLMKIIKKYLFLTTLQHWNFFFMKAFKTNL